MLEPRSSNGRQVLSPVREDVVAPHWLCYAYDKSGNILRKQILRSGRAGAPRTPQSDDYITTTFAFDAANQLVSSTTDGVTTRYTYDAAGRLVKEGSKTYRYGYLDKVMSVTDGDTKRIFTYHADGQLASASCDGIGRAGAPRTPQTETFLWDGLSLVKRGDEQFINEPHVGGGNPVASSSGTTYFNDMLGTTVGSKSNGKYSAAALTAFGEDLSVNSSGESSRSPFPVPHYPDGWNQLAYCGNGVTRAVDLFGGWCEEVHHDINATYLTNQGIDAHSYRWGSLSLDVLSGLNAGSDWTDNLWIGNQADDKAYYHAMRSSNQSTVDAGIAWSNYMNELVTNAKYWSDCARWAYAYYRFDVAMEYEMRAITELGKLLHTFDDSYAPPHSGFQHFDVLHVLEHRSMETLSVYLTGIYDGTTYHEGGYRDYIYNAIVGVYNATVWYVLRQQE